EAQTLARRGAMADGTIHLLAAEHELNGPVDQARRHDAQHLRSRDQALASEAAAEERAADMDMIGRNSEQASNPRRRQREAVSWSADGELVAFRRGGDRGRLDRIGKSGGRLTGALDHLRGPSRPRLHITVLDDRRTADAHGGWDKALARVEADAR